MKMTAEKLVKRPQIGVRDMIEFEGFSSDIVVAANKWDNHVPKLASEKRCHG